MTLFAINIQYNTVHWLLPTNPLQLGNISSISHVAIIFPTDLYQISPFVDSDVFYYEKKILDTHFLRYFFQLSSASELYFYQQFIYFRNERAFHIPSQTNLATKDLFFLIQKCWLKIRQSTSK